MKLLILLTFLPFVFTLTKNDIDFAVRYFKHRNVKYVCVLTCENKLWTTFAKQSINNYISVSTVLMDKFDRNKIDSCLSTWMGDIGVFVENNCPIFADILLHASQKSFFDAKRKWLIMDSNETQSRELSKMIEIYSEINFSIDTDVVLSYVSENGYQMYEMFNYGKIQGGKLIVNDLGIYNEIQGFDGELNKYKYYRRWDFNQLTMRMVVVVTEPIKVLDPRWLAERTPKTGLATFIKTAWIVLNEVAEIHNIRYNYTLSDRWVGSYSFNETIKAVATSLYFKMQDVSPVLRHYTYMVGKVYLLNSPLTYMETRYYYRIPTYGAGKFENQFLRPLSSGVWLSVVLVAAFCGCLLLASAKFERRASAGQYAFFSVLAFICQQFYEDDSGDVKSSGARKLTIFITGLACLLIYNYYTSSVVSWLLNGPPPSVNSLKELLDSPLDLMYEDVGYIRSWMKLPTYYFNKKNMKIETLMRQKKVWNKNPSELTTTLEKGIALVKAGGYAFHAEVDSANYIISRTFTEEDLCELGSVQSMEKTMLYTAVQHNSPYIEFLSWSLKRLTERGFVSTAQHRTRSLQVKCQGRSPRALALGGAAPAFILLAAGYVLAVAIMMLERLAERKKLELLRKILV